MVTSVLFLIALAVFGLCYAICHFVPNAVLATMAAVAAGIMGVIALLNLVK